MKVLKLTFVIAAFGSVYFNAFAKSEDVHSSNEITLNRPEDCESNLGSSLISQFSNLPSSEKLEKLVDYVPYKNGMLKLGKSSDAREVRNNQVAVGWYRDPTDQGYARIQFSCGHEKEFLKFPYNMSSTNIEHVLIKDLPIQATQIKSTIKFVSLDENDQYNLSVIRYPGLEESTISDTGYPEVFAALFPTAARSIGFEIAPIPNITSSAKKRWGLVQPKVAQYAKLRKQPAAIKAFGNPPWLTAKEVKGRINDEDAIKILLEDDSFLMAAYDNFVMYNHDLNVHALAIDMLPEVLVPVLWSGRLAVRVKDLLEKHVREGHLIQALTADKLFKLTNEILHWYKDNNFDRFSASASDLFLESAVGVISYLHYFPEDHTATDAKKDIEDRYKARVVHHLTSKVTFFRQEKLLNPYYLISLIEDHFKAHPAKVKAEEHLQNQIFAEIFKFQKMSQEDPIFTWLRELSLDNSSTEKEQTYKLYDHVIQRLGKPDFQRLQDLLKR